MNKIKLFQSFVFVLSVFFIVMPVNGHASEAKKTPDKITIATVSIGGAGHTMATSLGEVLKKDAGIKTNVVPVSAPKARLKYLQSKSAQFLIGAGEQMNDAQWGTTDFATSGWGPQPLQMAWFGPAYLGILTTKDHEDINTIEDIRGKRVAVLAQTAPMRLVQAYLAFAGMTWEDVKKVPVPGYIAQFKALLAKRVDVVPITNTMTSMLYEVQASPGGMKWIPLPHKNKEAWEKLRNVVPAGMPVKITHGPKLSEENPLEGFVHAYSFFVYNYQDTEIVYTMTKTIWENIEKLHAMAGAWKVYTKEFALGIEGFPHSYHPGAVKFFKEKGVWTPQHEKWNTEQVLLQENLNEAWEPFVQKAKQEKWESLKMKEEWHAKVKEITGYDIPVVEVK